jgi:molybdenum cofactor cytidylyltransferase
MGRPKQMLPLRGRPLLQHVAETAASALPESVLVLGPGLDVDFPLPANVRAVVNPRAAEGQATSLQAGLTAMGPRVSAAVILLGDQPGVRADAIRAVAGAEGPIARASYAGRPGHPVRLDRSIWPQVMALEGDTGARELLRDHPDWLVEVEVGGDPPQDVDTPDDYDRLIRG